MRTSVLAEALSAQERYAREVDRVLAQVGRLDAAAVRRAMALLTEARRRIIATLAEVPEGAYLAQYLPRLQAEVEAQMGRYARDYGDFLDAEARVWAERGVELVERPLAALQVPSLALQVRLPGLDPQLMDLLQGYRASLITGISDQAIDRITSTLQLGVLSGETPFQMQRTVADILSTQPSPAGVYHGLAARAEVITRTELNRVFSLSVQQRQHAFQDRLAQTFPDVVVRKRWLNSNDDRVRPAHRRQALLDQRPALDEDFVLIEDGVEYPAQGPHDARLPASLSVNCRCRSIIDEASLSGLLEVA